MCAVSVLSRGERGRGGGGERDREREGGRERGREREGGRERERGREGERELGSWGLAIIAHDFLSCSTSVEHHFSHIKDTKPTAE